MLFLGVQLVDCLFVAFEGSGQFLVLRLEVADVEFYLLGEGRLWVFYHKLVLFFVQFFFKPIDLIFEGGYFPFKGIPIKTNLKLFFSLDSLQLNSLLLELGNGCH